MAAEEKGGKEAGQPVETTDSGEKTGKKTEAVSDQAQPESVAPRPLTPARQRRLQQAFQAANTQMRQGNFDYSTDLFVQCVFGDPSNVIYIQSFLANMESKYNRNRKGAPMAGMKTAGAKAGMMKSSMQSKWMDMLKSAVEICKLNPWDVGALRGASQACEGMGFTEAQLVWLRAALAVNPKDPEMNRFAGTLLHRLGLLEDAMSCWVRVKAALPMDEEADREISTIHVERTINAQSAKGDGARKGAEGQQVTAEMRMEQEIRRHPDDLSLYLQLIDLHLREDSFDKALNVVGRAIEAWPENVDLVEKREDVEMRKVRQALEKAEAEADPNDQASVDRVNQARKDVFLRELEFAESRCQRYPNNLNYKYELGIRYQMAGKVNEAIAEFQQARNDPRRRGLCLLALGQCFQRIKQYRLAMSYYRDAIEEITERDPDNRKRTLYLAGKLAVYLGDLDNGEKWLSELAKMDFAYKDVSALLDRILQMRQNRGPAPGGATEA
ncbi:MAG: hypothetical protein Q4C47_04260 [Planctomycetia bacterium]|nr:hypothetical protein [Planctomycetia bacterium]